MLKGRVTKIIYQANDFVIARLKDRIEVTILGNIYGLNKGDYLHILEAKEEYHKTFGKQYRVIRWEKPIPTSYSAAIEYLCLIKGIGPVRAKNIVKHLGANALQRIIDEGPKILEDIPYIGKRAEEIYLAVLEEFELHLLMQELSPLGLNWKHITTAYKQLGPEKARKIKDNPYLLVHYNIASFDKADAIALLNGESKNSPRRIWAAFKEALACALRLGDCYLPKDILFNKSLGVLKVSIDKSVLEGELTNALESNFLIAEGDNIYLPNCFYAEKEIALAIAQLNKRKKPPRKLSSIIAQYEKNTHIQLAIKQREAIKTLFSSNIMILTGGPGTGKTETIKAIVNIYEAIFPSHKIAQAAPTGRASRRLAEISGKEAKTIHRLLGIQPSIGPQYHPYRRLPYDLIVIDEFSMVDLFIAKDLFRAINPNSTLLIVGDKDQLPSVGPGNIFHDLLRTNIPVIELTKVFRQAAESQIVLNAHRVNRGENIITDPNKTDFYFLQTEDPYRILSLTQKSVARLIEKGYDIDDIQVLVPAKKDMIGTYNINNILQEAINPTAIKEIKYGRKIFRINDKVMQVENNYDKEVFNGDIGKIVDIAPLFENGEKVEDEVLYVEYGDKKVYYRSSELDQLEHAYAATIHKSQGGEYRAVVLVLASNHQLMATRNLLYTGITRAKEFLCIIGSGRTLHKAIQDNKVSQRYTGLAEKVNEYLGQKLSLAQRG